MIKSISLENFMSHRATRIDLAPGVTVITGPNNVGKSAVVEAVRSLVQNPSQKFSIRHGARQAVVRLELDSGEVIEWVRTDKTAYYRVLRPQAGAPEEYRKIGLTVPEDIQTLLRLGRVEAETGDIDIHIGNQREPIFLLNSPGSQAAGFFAASSEAEYLLRMRQALKSQVDYTKTTRKVLAGECQALEKGLERYQGLEILGPELEQAEQTYEVICENQESLPVLWGFMGNLADQEQALSRQEQSAAILAGLPRPPEPQEVAGLEALLQHWRHLAGEEAAAANASLVLEPLAFPPPLEETASLAPLGERLGDTEKLLEKRRQEWEGLAGLAEPSTPAPVSDLKNLAETLHGKDLALAANRSLEGVFQDLQEAPAIHDVLPLEQLLEILRTREDLKNRARHYQETLAVLAGPVDFADVGDLLRLIAQLSRLHDQKRRLEGLSEMLGGLAAVPATTPVLDLEELISRTAGVLQEISRKQQDRHSLNEALEHKRTEAAELIRETGLCPLCGSPMDVAHFLEAAHG